MSWIVFSQLNGDVTNVVDGQPPTIRDTVDYRPMDDGREGAGFGSSAGGTTTDAARLIYEIPETHRGRGLENGLVVMRYRPTRDFDFAVDSLEYALWSLVNGIEASATGDFIRSGLNYNLTTKTGLEYVIRKNTPLAQRTGQLPQFALQSGQEVHLAWAWNTDPADPSGNPNLRIYINGWCVLNWGNTPLNNYPPSVKEFVVGNLNAAGNRPAQGVMQDMGLALGERFSDADIRRMADGKYEFTSLRRPTKISRLDVEQQTLDYHVVHHDTDDARLWGFDAGTRTTLAYTDDLTGRSGWVRLFTHSSEIRDITTTKGFVFVSIGGSLRRAPKSDLSAFTEVLDTTSGGVDNFAVPGWGLTSIGANVVIGEYFTPVTAGGLRVMHSPDNGDTWHVRHTMDASGSSANAHIHGVEYCPFTGELWLSTGDDIAQLAYSLDHGENWIWLNGEDDHDYQALNYAFSPDFVVCGIDRSGPDHMSGLICFNRATKKSQPWEGAAGTNGTRWHTNLFYSAHGAGLFRGSGWSVQRMQDGRWVVYRDNEGNPGKCYLEILSPDLGKQVRLIDLGTQQITRGSAMVTLGRQVFVGNRRFVIEADSPELQSMVKLDAKISSRALKEDVTLLSRTWSGALLEAGESYSWPVDYPIEVTDPQVSVKVNGVEVATATASGTGTSFVFVFTVPAGVTLGDTVLVETAEDQPRAVVTGQVVEADASESFAAEISVEVVKGLTGNPVVLTQPVSPHGQIVGPLVIGDDYLAVNQRALIWTIPPIPGVTPATATTQLGFSHTRHGGVEVSGTVADNGDDTWTLIFGIESSDTEDAIKPGEYSWSVQVTSSDGKKITRVRNRDDCYRVRWVEKQTS